MAHRSRSARRRAQAHRIEIGNSDSIRPDLNCAETNRAEINRSEINRANASHSTGPRTPEGKAASRGNALKHGLFARSIRLPSEQLGEDRGAFEALQAELVEHHEPQGLEERLMVERIATIWWLLARLNTQSQFKLKCALEAGTDPVEALAESAVASPAEARLERSLMRLHRNLAFLQKWRTDRRQRREVAAFEEEWAAEEAQMEAIIQDGLRRSRERERIRMEADETEMEGMEADETEMEGMEAETTKTEGAEGEDELPNQSAA
jgi:hypothetical protein